MSKQLSAEWEEKIESDMHEISKKFKTGTEYGVGYDHGFHYGYSLSAANYLPQLVEAQERIKNIEKGIGDLIADMEGWRKACIDDMKRVEFNEDRSIGYDLNGRSKAEYDGILPRLKALSPNNKQKEDE